MAQQLKNILHFSLPSGGSQTLPHGLNIDNGRSVIPDHAECNQCGFEIIAVDDENVTVEGIGDVDVLVEYWHTLERSFGATGIDALDPHPFIPCGSGPEESQNCLFSTVTTTIYARLTGNDDTGDGLTIPTAYRTFQRALCDVPLLIPAGHRYIIDITGIGTETLPQGYSFPPISSGSGVFPIDNSIPYFYAAFAVTVRALPELVTLAPPTDAVIDGTAGATIAADPDTGLITLTIAAPRASWDANALAGKQLIRTANSPIALPGLPAYLASCVITDSTTTTLNLTCTAANFNSVVGALLLDPGVELHIVQPSAQLQAPVNSVYDIGGNSDASISCNVAYINFQGIAFATSNPPGFQTSLAATHATTLELCTVDGLALGADGGGSGAIQIPIYATVITTALFSFGPTTLLQQSYVSFVFFMYLQGAQFSSQACVWNFCCVISNMNTTPPSTLNGSFALSLTAGNTYVRQTTAYVPGVFGAGSGFALNNGRVQLANTKIAGAAVDGVHLANGNVYGNLTKVSGSANGNLGISCDDGARCQVDLVDMAIVGAAGAVKSGTLAIVADWATFYGARSGIQYDLTATAASPDGASGTGSIIFAK